ncbi:MAG: sugar transferase [Rhodocyclaceae bacterium]|nr:sugar transferase [Rhodocyclaceae bacterium]
MLKPFIYCGRWGGLLQLSFDAIFLGVIVFSSIKWIDHGPPVGGAMLGLYAAALVVAAMALKAWSGDWQRPAHRLDLPPSWMRLGFLLYLVVPSAYAVSAVLPLAEMDRQLVELSALAVAFTVLTTRAIALPGTAAAIRYRVLVFGIGEKAGAVEKALRESDPAVEIVGFYPGPLETEAKVMSNGVLSRAVSLTDTAVELQADSIVVAVTERRGGLPLRELLDCRLCGVRVLDLESYFEQTLGQIRLDALYAGWLVFGQGFRQGALRSAVKRLSDVVFAAALLTLALPVMALAAILIVLESGFPILYRQERVGRNGRLFNVIKFRSMRTDAEKDGKPRWATAQDDRITRVGRVIRKLRIDELPQLFSVLAGDMSLVGPRPERPFFVDKLMREIPFYAVRHSIKPGLTGWAQVRYHYGATVEDSAEKLQYDLYYVKNHSLALDLLILFKTVGVVLTGKGAN